MSEADQDNSKAETEVETTARLPAENLPALTTTTISAASTQATEQTPDLTVYPDDNPQPPQEKSPLKTVIMVALLLGLLGFVGYGVWHSYRQPKTITLQGIVEGDSVQVSTKVPSRIEHIMVHEGDSVQKGQILIQLSSPEIVAKQQQAAAALKSARALQATAERGSQPENLATLYANWQSSIAQAELANQTYTRGNYLYQQGVIARQRRDEMFAAKQSAEALSEAAHQQYLRAKRGATTEQKISADAQVELAQAGVNEANALQAETELRAPISGIVTNVYGQDSELVATAVPVVTILQQEHWVSLNVREDQYAAIYQKTNLEGYIPALNRNAMFKIIHIEPEGDFATIKTTRQTGGYDIRSFKIKLLPATTLPDLKVGMSVIFNVPHHSTSDENP